MPKAERVHGERWKLEERSLTAQIFEARRSDMLATEDRDWNLGGFLAGDYAGEGGSGFDAWTADGTAWQTEQPPPPEEGWESGDNKLGDGCSPWDVHATPVFGCGARPEDFEAMDEFGGW